MAKNVEKNTTDDIGGLRINVKFGTDVVIPQTISPEWTIKQLKEKLEPQLKVPATHLKIIFAGRQLDDNLNLEDCNVGNHTVLNAVRTKEVGQSSTNQDDFLTHHPLLVSVLKIQCPEDERSNMDPLKVNFFVYCGDPCKCVSAGKLRVRCSICKQGTLIVSKDPSCWDDVLLPGKIPGTCQSKNCEGTIAEFFFRCASHVRNTDDEEAVALHHIKNNFKNVPCLACGEIIQVVLVFSCKNGHVICLDCFRDYCISRLGERGFISTVEYGYTLPCPIGCADSYIKEAHHFRLLNNEQYSRYQEHGAEDYLLSSGGVLCPQPGCGAGILPDDNCKRVVCLQTGGQGCGFVFCRNCLQGYHLGECEEVGTVTNHEQSRYVLNDQQSQISRWEEEENKTVIRSTTKPCPKCRTPTERDGGCMHMVCIRTPCGYHWCWICQTEWTRDCMGAHWFG